MIVTLLIWFPQTILCFTNYKTKRKPYHRSKLDSQSINCFVTLISNFSLQEKEEEAWNFCWKHWRPTKVHGRPQEGVLHAAQQILPDHQKKLALVLLSGASYYLLRLHCCPRKCWLGSERSTLTFSRSVSCCQSRRWSLPWKYLKIQRSFGL